MNLCARLAFGNLRRGARSTLPFLLCVSGTAAMFYNLCFLKAHPDPLIAAGDGELRVMLSFGIGVVAVFALIVLYYTNSIDFDRTTGDLYGVLTDTDPNTGSGYQKLFYPFHDLQQVKKKWSRIGTTMSSWRSGIC